MGAPITTLSGQSGELGGNRRVRGRGRAGDAVEAHRPDALWLRCLARA